MMSAFSQIAGLSVGAKNGVYLIGFVWTLLK